MAPSPRPLSFDNIDASSIQDEFNHPNDSKSVEVFAGTIPVLVIATLFLATRLYYRAFPTMKLWWDDLFLVLAYLTEFASLVLSYITLDLSGGRHIVFIPLAKISIGIKLGFLIFILAPVVNCFIKISVSLMLLRIKKNDPTWRIGLWTLIIVTSVVTAGNVIAVLCTCRPIHAFWDLDLALGHHCWSPKIISNIAIGFGCYYVVTDFIMAILPVLFIRNIQMPLRNRIILSLLMAVGLFAMAAGIIKVTLWPKAIQGIDFFYNLAGLQIWLALELLIGIIAACVPTLRAPFEKLLRKTGILRSRQGSTHRIGMTNTVRSNVTRRESVPMDSRELNKSTRDRTRSYSGSSTAPLDTTNCGEKQVNGAQLESGVCPSTGTEEEEDQEYAWPLGKNGSKSPDAETEMKSF